jgi:hypothetical protein
MTWYYAATDSVFVLIPVGLRKFRREQIKTQASLEFAFEGWGLVFAIALTGCAFALLVLMSIVWNRVFKGAYLPWPRFIWVSNNIFQTSMALIWGFVTTVKRKH